MLVVNGVSEYNDSTTSVFRDMAKRSSSNSVSFAYIDGSLQEAFLSNFAWSEAHMKCKNSQEMARKASFGMVMVLRCRPELAFSVGPPNSGHTFCPLWRGYPLWEI